MAEQQLRTSSLWQKLSWHGPDPSAWQLAGFVHYSTLLLLWRNSICLSVRNSSIFTEFCLTSFDWPSWTEVVVETTGYLRSLLLIHSAVPTPPIIVLFCSFPPAINGPRQNSVNYTSIANGPRHTACFLLKSQIISTSIGV